MTTRHVTIDRLGHLGDGIVDDAARDPPLYVPYALPGEEVEITQSDGKAELQSIKTPSPDRIEPICPHFGTCGGCAVQHLAPKTYRRWKRMHIDRAFRDHGLGSVKLSSLAVVPLASRRRAVLAAFRNGKTVQLGFYGRASHDIVDVDHCPLLTSALNKALAHVRALLSDVLIANKGARLTLIETDTGLDLDLASPSHRTAFDQARLAKIAGAFAFARISIDGDPIIELQAPQIKVGQALVALPPAAFLQATRQSEAAIAKHVVDAVGDARSIADLFCGVGTFALRMAEKAHLYAADGWRPAVAALDAAARQTPALRPVQTDVRDLAQRPLQRDELKPFDAVVFDPPRAGAGAQAQHLASSQVPTIVAVSCNPTTLARDCRQLIDGGYDIVSLAAIDQFLYSHHIECVAVLKRS